MADIQDPGAARTVAISQNLINKQTALAKPVYDKLVADTIQLALFHSYRRQPIRKEDLNKKVLGKNASLWPIVLKDVQKKLKNKLGMELVELRPRGQGQGQTVVAEEEEQDQGQGKGKGKRKADDQGNEGAKGDEAGKKKKVSAPAKVYALRSTLPQSLISLLCVPSSIRPPPHPSLDDNAADHRFASNSRIRVAQEAIDRAEADPGSIVDWNRGEGGQGSGVELKGLLFVVLGIILVRDRVIVESQLMKELAKLNLRPTSILPFTSPQSPTGHITLEQALAAWLKQNYLEKNKVTSAVRSGRDAADQPYEWQWGSRADAEFGEQQVVEFMLDISADAQVSDDDDEPRSSRRGQATSKTAKNRQDKRADKRKKMWKKIEQASGGKLAEATESPALAAI